MVLTAAKLLKVELWVAVVWPGTTRLRYAWFLYNMTEYINAVKTEDNLVILVSLQSVQ
eukprot:GAHX01006005.1.p1 GENE.GAHX01006005.1~~GAHX01006005.1.p1  ORF type:complete len:58 (+),score=4.07 GAHX01006005.1:16-189(+)